MNTDSITVEGRDLPVWPRGTRVTPLDANIQTAAFADAEAINPGLIRYLLDRADREDDVSIPASRLFGGIKIYHVHQWGVPEADLLHARALAFYRQTLQTSEAHVDLCWANVYRTGDCSAPHGHGNTTASVVYMLDLGDEEEGEPFCGRFSFVDPRLDLCCREQPGVMTSPFFPTLDPGNMIIFPGQLVHFVTPYFGARPRITIAWNINNQPGPGSTVQGQRPDA
ncbi:MAG: putative 2OG-Fe(II) oxygenase [Alphaproteobacteria bacterium]|nr:putative 2OG-Fe(II) oxygenase [Alphaproteobacteria bacterium]